MLEKNYREKNEKNNEFQFNERRSTEVQVDLGDKGTSIGCRSAIILGKGKQMLFFETELHMSFDTSSLVKFKKNCFISNLQM